MLLRPCSHSRLHCRSRVCQGRTLTCAARPQWPSPASAARVGVRTLRHRRSWGRCKWGGPATGGGAGVGVSYQSPAVGRERHARANAMLGGKGEQEGRTCPRTRHSTKLVLPLKLRSLNTVSHACGRAGGRVEHAAQCHAPHPIQVHRASNARTLPSGCITCATAEARLMGALTRTEPSSKSSP